jgi:hypothetical protein
MHADRKQRPKFMHGLANVVPWDDGLRDDGYDEAKRTVSRDDGLRVTRFVANNSDYALFLKAVLTESDFVSAR